MQISFTYFLALSLKEGEPVVCFSEKVPRDNRVYPHGDWLVNNEEIRLCEAVEKFLRKENLQYAFANYYKDNIDSTVSNPFHPSWKLRALKEIQNFLKNHPEYLVVIFYDVVNLDIQLL